MDATRMASCTSLKSAVQHTGSPSAFPPLSKQPLSRKGKSQERPRKPSTIASSSTSSLPKISTQQKPLVPSRLDSARKIQTLKYNRDYSLLFSTGATGMASEGTSLKSAVQNTGTPSAFPPQSKQPLSRKGESQARPRKSSTSTSSSISSLRKKSMQQKPLVPSRLGSARKIQTLKYNRDYSFLLSVDVSGMAREGKSIKSAVSNTGIPSTFPPLSKLPLSRNGECQELPRKSSTATSSSCQEKGNEKYEEKKPLVPSRLGSACGRVSVQPLVSRKEEQKKPSSFPPKSAAMQRRSITKGETPLSMSQKQPVTSSSSNPKVTQSQRLPKISVRANAMDDHQPKKRPRRNHHEVQDPEELDYAISEIRKMFRYNPKKYMDRDYEDDRKMEANFQEIQREEKRSARIARKEDREELRKVQEEERKERLEKKNAKKRKIEETRRLYEQLGLLDDDDDDY